MWQPFVASGYRDVSQKMVQLATSGSFATGGLGVTNGGSGYTDGDILTISHASGVFPCTFAVNVSGGVIVGIKRIITGGCFANRVTSAAVNAGGTGYAVNDVVGILTGLASEPAKLIVTSVSSGVVTGVSIFEGGGSYAASTGSGAPNLTACPTTRFIGTGSGTGLTVNITMQAILIPIGIVPTGGTGSGGTFGGTITSSGWTVLRSVNNYSLNTVNDEKEIVLFGTAQTGQEAPILGIRTGTNGSGGSLRHFLAFSPMTDFNGLSSYDTQLNILNPVPSTSAGTYLPILPASSSIQCYFSCSGRAIRIVSRADGGTTTVYHAAGYGAQQPFGTATENPAPFVLFGSASSVAIAADSNSQLDISGPTECFKNSGRAGPFYFWSQATTSWVEFFNSSAASGSPPFTISQSNVMWPVGKPLNQTDDTKADYIVENGGWASYGSFCRADGGSPATLSLKPTPYSGGNAQTVHPACLILAASGAFLCALENIYWVSGIKEDGSSIAPEDTFTFTVGPTQSVFRVFPNGSRTLGYSWFCMQEGF